MTTHKISLSKILVRDRLRQDKGDISDLASSFQRVGQIHPILLSELSQPTDLGKTHRLVAGERRFLAAEHLKWEEIEFTTRGELSDEDLFEIELEENIKRQSHTWQEHALAISKIHRLKQQRNWSLGQEWGVRATSEMLGINKSDISVMNIVAAELRSDPNSPCWKADSYKEAWKLIPGRALLAVEAELARRTTLAKGTVLEEQQSANIITEVEDIAANETTLALERARYEANPLNTVPFDEYWKEKLELAETARNTVYLASRFLNVNCLDYMQDSPHVDHIITDPPYMIDMAMLAQENTGMTNIESVEKEHDVKENELLLIPFVSSAFDMLKDCGTLVMWCDSMNFPWLHNIALSAGFSVQRWPFVWLKPNFHSNQAAQYNMTKCTEIALIARKGGILLTRNDIPNFVIHPFGDDMTSKMRHPFAKPFGVWKPLIEAVSLPGQLIYEPFMGEGSGVISMLQLGRNVVATEKVPEHFNAGLEQIKQFYLKQNGKVVFR